MWNQYITVTHNGRDGAPNHQPRCCLLNRLIRRRSKKTSKLRVTGLCGGNSPVNGEFHAQMASNAEYVSIWWRHHDIWFNNHKTKKKIPLRISWDALFILYALQFFVCSHIYGIFLATYFTAISVIFINNHINLVERVFLSTLSYDISFLQREEYYQNGTCKLYVNITLCKWIF